MAQNANVYLSKEEKEKQLVIKLHRAILDVKIAKVGSTTVKVHHLEGIQNEVPYEKWKNDGRHEYEAEAEFFFVSKAHPKDYHSLGILKFKVDITKNGDRFELLEPLTITDKVSTMTLVPKENDITFNNKENNHETENS